MTPALEVKLLVKKQPEHEIRVKLAEWVTDKPIWGVCKVLFFIKPREVCLTRQGKDG